MFSADVPMLRISELDPVTPIPPGSTLLDVREQDEWETGHAVGALHIPIGELPGRAGELPDEGRILVVCQAGVRSERATAWLIQAGYEAVNLEGGMAGWFAAGLPLA